MGTMMSVFSLFRFWRMEVRAAVSPLAFCVTISMPGSSARFAMMVSRIWSREVWVMGWTMATLTFFPSAAAGAGCAGAAGASDAFSAGAAAVPAMPLPPHPVSTDIMTETAAKVVSIVFFICFSSSAVFLLTMFFYSFFSFCIFTFFPRYGCAPG